jgi:tetratricopeptide (TPR) repeat protein
MFTRTALMYVLVVLLLAGCQGRRSTVKEEGMQQWNAARASVMHGMAHGQYQIGNFDRARNTVEQGLKLDPFNVPLLILSAKLAIEQGQLEIAERELELARKHGPGNAEAFYLSGVVHQRWQRPEAAFEFYRQAHEKAPAELAYLMAQAELLVILDRTPEALKMLQERVVYFEHSPAIRDAVGQLLMQQGEYRQAAEIFRQASILSSDDLQIRESLALALYHDGQYAEAAAILARLLQDERFEKRFDLLIALGESQMQLNRHREARTSFDAATRLAPGSALGWRSLGKACVQIEDYRRADLALRKSLAIDPGNSEGHLIMGYLRLRQGQLEESLRLFHQAHTLDRRDIVSLCMIGYVLERQGRPEQAMRYYGHALRLSPGDQLATSLMAALID